MDKALNRTSLIWGIPGVIVQTLGWIIANGAQTAPLALVGSLLFFGGTGVLLVGLTYYARAKGHSAWWGLVGFFSCVGILVLAFLPDRLKEEKAEIASIDELDLPDGTQSPFGSSYEPKPPSEQ